ncbi:ACT domain-containing protein [Nocardioides daphniae]|nr:ACT domain-containing protein [Nocardioides daphniae]QCC77160.1 ACT domain-containing protein [Nocardioides daphniae]
MTGVLVALLTPMAEAEISVFTLSTFDTDWILVPKQHAEKAAEEWRRRGHTVAPAVPA